MRAGLGVDLQGSTPKASNPAVAAAIAGDQHQGLGQLEGRADAEQKLAGRRVNHKQMFPALGDGQM